MTIGALAATIAEQGAAIREEACQRAVAAAMEHASPSTITDARIETRVECCRGAGYVVTYSEDGCHATVTRCPCLMVLIVTRIRR